MPEASAPKILVQNRNGDYYLISEDAAPVPVPTDSNLTNIVHNTNDALESFFTSFVPPGVKIGITIVDF
jgi:hypothetical protein